MWYYHLVNDQRDARLFGRAFLVLAVVMAAGALLVGPNPARVLGLAGASVSGIACMYMRYRVRAIARQLAKGRQ